jgi:hypothetical protein
VPELVHERFVCHSSYQGADYVGILHIGKIGALPGEAMNVLVESLSHLLPAVPQVQQISRAYIGALEVDDEGAP